MDSQIPKQIIFAHVSCSSLGSTSCVRLSKRKGFCSSFFIKNANRILFNKKIIWCAWCMNILVRNHWACGVKQNMWSFLREVSAKCKIVVLAKPKWTRCRNDISEKLLLSSEEASGTGKGKNLHIQFYMRNVHIFFSSIFSMISVEWGAIQSILSLDCFTFQTDHPLCSFTLKQGVVAFQHMGYVFCFPKMARPAVLSQVSASLEQRLLKRTEIDPPMCLAL